MSLHPSLRNRPPATNETHVICCNHPHLTLCSHALRDVKQGSHGAHATCVVCRDLSATEFCPARDKCPTL